MWTLYKTTQVFRMKIYIGNLDFRITEQQISQLFDEYSSFSSVKMINDRETGRFKGFAFAEVEDQAEAEAAIAKLHGSEVNGRSIVANEARPQPERRNNFSSRY